MAKKVAKKTVAEMAEDATALLAEGAEFQEYTPQCPIDFTTLLDTGVGPLNQEISSRFYGGMPRSNCVRYSGKASSGKTFNLLSMLACAANDPAYDDYALVADDVENGMMMDMAKFGTKIQKRLKRIRSLTLEESYFALMDQMEKGPCVYIIDSLDALSSKAEQDKTTKKRNAKTAKQKAELSGDMSDGKAKVHSAMLRQLEPLWVKTGSIVVLVSQYRDDLKSKFGGGKESGGRALEHYPSIHVKTAAVGKIEKIVLGSKRHIGNMVQATVSKTRVIGGGGNKVVFPLYFDSGIDDIGAAVEYLISEKYWSEAAGKVEAPEFQYKGATEKLIVQLHDNPDARQTLDVLCTRRWNEIRGGMKTGRKPRFA